MAKSSNTWFKKLRAKQKKFALRHTVKRFAVEPDHDTTVKKVRDYLGPVKLDFVPRKPRGRSGCRMSHEKRLLILIKHEKRAAFFAELGVTI